MMCVDSIICGLLLYHCRCYLQIFYPPAKLADGSPNPLRDPKLNMWLTTCGIQQTPQGKHLPMRTLPNGAILASTYNIGIIDQKTQVVACCYSKACAC
jgi:hypothetical protein